MDIIYMLLAFLTFNAKVATSQANNPTNSTALDSHSSLTNDGNHTSGTRGIATPAIGLPGGRHGGNQSSSQRSDLGYGKYVPAVVSGPSLTPDNQTLLAPIGGTTTVTDGGKGGVAVIPPSYGPGPPPRSVSLPSLNCEPGQNRRMIPQMILVGFSRSTIDAKSLDECIGQCLKAQTLYGFHCRSGMFYGQESSQNCILNSEIAAKHPEQFTAEKESNVSYFETDCIQDQSAAAVPSIMSPSAVPAPALSPSPAPGHQGVVDRSYGPATSPVILPPPVSGPSPGPGPTPAPVTGRATESTLMPLNAIPPIDFGPAKQENERGPIPPFHVVLMNICQNGKNFPNRLKAK